MKKKYTSTDIANIVLANYKEPLIDNGIAFMVRIAILEQGFQYVVRSQSLALVRADKDYILDNGELLFYTVADVVNFLDNETNYIVLENHSRNGRFKVAKKTKDNKWIISIIMLEYNLTLSNTPIMDGYPPSYLNPSVTIVELDDADFNISLKENVDEKVLCQ